MIIGGLGVIGVYEYVEPRGRVLARKFAPKGNTSNPEDAYISA